MTKYITLNDVVTSTGLSLPMARKLVDEAKAVTKVGRRVLVNQEKLQAYMDAKSEVGGNGQ
jgi:hypothetical protein